MKNNVTMHWKNGTCQELSHVSNANTFEMVLKSLINCGQFDSLHQNYLINIIINADFFLACA